MIHDLVILLVVNFVLWLWVFIFPVLVFSFKRLPSGRWGMVFLPGVVLLGKDVKNDTDALNHELIHQLQIKRYSPIIVAIYLGWYYGKGLLMRKKNIHALYYNNPLEKEAYTKMHLPVNQKYIKLYK